MKVKVLSLSLGLAALAGMSSPGVAGGDWADASIKDYSAAVPVPAPIPVAMYHPQWYFRIDAGFGFGDSVDASESGMLFGDSPINIAGTTYSSAAPFGSDSSWLSADYTNSAVYNLGVGYYWTQRFRTDLTVESRRSQAVDIDGSQATALTVGGVVPGNTADTFNASTNDHTLIRGAVFMLNGYYDFTQFGAFKPYIGGGVGFGYTDLERKNETSTSTSGPGGAADTIELSSSSSRDRQQVTQTALAATVGFSYQLTDITDLDFGYRFLWVEGAHADLTVNGHGSSIKIDDTMEHQIRAGVRFNVF